MELKIKIDFNKIERRLEEAIEDALQELAPILENYARNQHSYTDRSGNLSRNTIANTLKNKLNVLAKTPYASFVIDGTSTISPDKGLGDILEVHEKLINETLERHIKKALSSINGR